MKIKLTIICLLFSGGIWAQAKLSYSLSGYLEGQFETCDSLTMQKRSGGKRFLFGGADYMPLVNDDAVMSRLEKKVRIIETGDSLFINCRNLTCNKRKLGNGYASGVLIKDRLFFSAPSNDGSGMMMGMLFGAIGAAIAAASSANDNWVYMLSDDSKELKRVKKPHMLYLLSENEELKKAYEKEKEPEDDETIEKYLYDLYQLTKAK